MQLNFNPAANITIDGLRITHVRLTARRPTTSRSRTPISTRRSSCCEATSRTPTSLSTTTRSRTS
jgi:hypothetical protein